jgi:zinc protease
MKFRHWAGWVVGMVAAASGLAAPALPFPQASSDVAPDPAARFGALPNGLRYVIYPNHEPRERASLRLLVLAGSLNENADQQGLAHFLEHMAFNGSAHYPPGTLIEFFQRMGMNFGGDTNASTEFNRTTYQIELPNVKPDTLTEGLQVFSDMAGSLLLTPDMINKERPIILSEKRTRDSVDYRQFVASFGFLLPDSLVPHRLPIGQTPVIEQAGRDRFEDFYRKWYRPERMVVVVVGDVDPAAVAPKIEAAFGGLTDRTPAPAEPDLGVATSALGLKTGYHYEAEAAATTVSIDVVLPYHPPLDSRAVRLSHLRRDLALAMLNRRLSILAKKEGAPFTRAAAAVDESFRFVHDAGINVTCDAGQWRPALAVAEQQLRGALQFGFTQPELAEAAANVANALEQAAADAKTRRSPELADGIVSDLMEREVVTSPAQDLALFGPELKRLTPEACAAALRLAFQGPGRYVLVAGNAKLDGNAAAAVASAYEESRAVPVPPPEKLNDAAFAYTAFGTPGKIAARRTIGDLAITEVTFANGVKLNLKKTDFETNQIRLQMRVGAGQLTEPKTQPGLGVFSDLTFEAGGLGKHSADELQRILSGHTVGLRFEVGSDALRFGATTNPAELRLQLQLLAAYLSDPGYRPESLRVARKNIEEYYSQLAHLVEGPLRTTVPILLASGDQRFGLPPLAVTRQRSLEEEKTWLTPQLTRGPLEIGIVGDLDVDATIAIVASTLGALPQRDSKPAYLAERTVHFPAQAFSREFTVPTQIPKSVVAVYWPTDDAWDIHRTRRLNLLREVFSDRLRVRIREELGGSYSPEAASEPSDTYTHYGLMLAEIVVAPDRAAEIQKSIVDVAADLAAHGVTEDQLARARLPVLTALRESARTNQYWLSAVVGSCQEFPQRLDWSRTRYADIESIQKAEVDSLAKEYLGADHAFRVVVSPEK